MTKGLVRYRAGGAPLIYQYIVGAPSFHSLIVKGWDSTNLNSPNQA